MLKKIFLFLIIIYAILGFFIIPYFAKPQIIEIVNKEINAKLNIDSIYLNPFVFKIELSGVELSSLEGKELLYLKSIMLNVDPSSLIYSSLHIKDFILNEPRISLVLDKNKQINFTSILKPSTEKKEENNATTHLPRIIIDTIAIVNGGVNYEDYSKKSAFHFALESIGFKLKNIDTKELSTSDAELRFYTLLSDGGFIDFKSEIIGLDPFIIRGNLDFEASKLYTQWRYIQDSLNLEVADGKLSFYTEYDFNLSDIESTTLSNLKLDLKRLRVKPKGDFKDVLTLASLSVESATIKPIAQDVNIKNIALNSLHLKASRDSKGVVDWLDFIKMIPSQSDGETPVVEESKKDSKPWNVLVDNIALEKISFDFEDSKMKPKVDTTLNEFNLYAQNVTLAGDEPLSYQMDLHLNDNFRCESKGEVIHRVLDAQTYFKCSEIDITDFNPYIDEIAQENLKVYNLALKNLMLGFDANVNVKDSNSTIAIEVSDANLVLNKLRINQRDTNKKIVSFNKFSVNDISFDSLSKEIGVDYLGLKYIALNTIMNQDGSLNLNHLVVPKKPDSKKTGKPKKKAKEFRIKLKKLEMLAGRVSFEDKHFTPSVESVIDGIYLSVYNVDSMKKTWLDYAFDARINKQGTIKSKGRVRHTPLKQIGNFEIDSLSLKELTPYVNESAYIAIDDGYFSLKSKIAYAKSETKPDLLIDGSMQLEEFFVNDSRDDSSLASLSNLDLKSFSLEILPNRMYIDQLDIDSFYVNAVIDENKTMNFATLAKKSDSNGSTQKVDSNTTTKEPAFPMKIMQVNVLNGSAKFADLSLPIKFRTDIHDLNGVIYAISNENEEISYVDITGEVDEYGSTKLKGSVNSAKPKVYTDLTFNFRNLELSSYSGYSATFAGYKIDSGKLYLDLGYNIFDSALLGKNNIMIKKIKLGDAVKEDTLPLGFVIALLEDSDGIIDIDMPVEGNVDEPDFKYGGLLMKTMGNLVVKAVSSPFRFLGSMMGMDGEALESLDFEAGLATILPPEKEKLDSIAKMMIKRPKISLSITGKYDEQTDKKALQKQKLAALVVQKSKEKNVKENKNSITIEILQEIYSEFRDDDKLDVIEDELEDKYEDETLQRAYLLAITKECVSVLPIEKLELESLAKKRVEMIKEYLIQDKNIPTKMITIKDIAIVDEVDSQWVKTKLEIEVQ